MPEKQYFKSSLENNVMLDANALWKHPVIQDGKKSINMKLTNK